MTSSTIHTSAPTTRILDKLRNVKPVSGGFLASCPVSGHGKGRGDRNPSLSVSENDKGNALVTCPTCSTEDVLQAIGLKMSDLFAENGRHRSSSARCSLTGKKPKSKANQPTATGDMSSLPPDDGATYQRSGLTVEKYAESKGLSVDLLSCNGVTTEQHRSYGQCVRIPYAVCPDSIH